METGESKALENLVRTAALPRHVGIIMDGNGTWAEKRGLSRTEGHREGSRSVRAVVRAARRVGIEALTLYAFSTQNWARPRDEVSALMTLLEDYLSSERDEILGNGIRLNAIGDLARLPESVREGLTALRAASSENSGMVLTLALSYGGREEILAAARAVAEQARRGEIVPAELTEAMFERHLWSGSLPPLDLVVRTRGEQRVSNFMLWGCAYAELVFTDALWPDFRDQAFFEAVREYQQRERRFGLTPAQAKR